MHSDKQYPFETQCLLELQSDTVESRDDYERWVFAIFDKEGKQIYRADILDKDVLSKREKSIVIKAAKLYGDRPDRYIIWPKLSDGKFTKRYGFPIPREFLDRYADWFRWIMSKTIPEKTVTCHIMGGLANQLFQIVNVVAFAYRHGYTPIFDTTVEESPSMVKNKSTYWDTVFANIVKLGENCRVDTRAQKTYPDPSFTYQPIPTDHHHLLFYGYFASYRYFHNERSYILSLLTPIPEVQQEIDRAYQKLQGKIPSGFDKTVSVHVRRGDALKNHTLRVLSPEYYRQAMEKFNGAVFVVFSDDILWCKEHFRFQNNTITLEGEKLIDSKKFQGKDFNICSLVGMTMLI